MTDKVLNAFEGLHVAPVSALSEQRGDWTDDIPKAKAKNNPFLYSCMDPNYISSLAVEWYNFYCGDILPPDQRVTDLIAKAMSLACTPISNTTLVPIWPDITTGPATWYRGTLISKEPMIKEEEIGSLELSTEYLAQVTKTMDAAQVVASFNYFGTDSQTTFRSQWLKWIEGVKKGNIDCMFTISNVMAYMAAVGLRCLSKDSNQMAASYLKTNFQENIKKVAKIESNLQIPAPTPNYILRLNQFVTKGSDTCRILLSHCLSVFLAVNIPHFQGNSLEPAKTFVKMTCLTHLEHNGLAVCSLFVRCLKTLPSTALDLAAALNCSQLAPSLIILAENFRKYEGQHRTWWWARAYDDGYLADLGWKSHAVLITILSVMLQTKAPLDHQGIMASQAVKSLNEYDKQRAVAFAETIVETCYSFVVDTKNSKINQAFEAKMKALKKDEEQDQQETAEALQAQEDQLKQLLEKVKTKAAPSKKVEQPLFQTIPSKKLEPTGFKSTPMTPVVCQLSPGHVASQTMIPSLHPKGDQILNPQMLVQVDDSGKLMVPTDQSTDSPKKRIIPFITTSPPVKTTSSSRGDLDDDTESDEEPQ